jgi:hypothetical protein
MPDVRRDVYTDALNGPPVHFHVLQSGDSDLARVGLLALEQGQSPRATALAQWNGAGINHDHFRKLVNSTLRSGPLPESRKYARHPEFRVVFDGRRDLPFYRSHLCSPLGLEGFPDCKWLDLNPGCRIIPASKHRESFDTN